MLLLYLVQTLAYCTALVVKALGALLLAEQQVESNHGVQNMYMV